VLDGYAIVDVDFPGALSTIVLGLNNRSQVVGSYLATSGPPDFTIEAHGFLYGNGAYSAVAPADYARGINDRGDIVISTNTLPAKGALLSGGVLSPIAVPNASLTFPETINDRGQIGGVFCCRPDYEAFLLDRGRYTTFSVPGAFATSLTAPNGRGDSVGAYEDRFFDDNGNLINTVSHAFVLSDHDITTLTIPGSLSDAASAINDRGDVVGFFDDLAGNHGWLRAADGTLLEFDLPGSTRQTIPTGINNRGQIAGYYISGVDRRTRGFIATPIPEPTGFGAACLGALVLLARRLRQTARPAASSNPGAPQPLFQRQRRRLPPRSVAIAPTARAISANERGAPGPALSSARARPRCASSHRRDRGGFP
jgi:hypothetical protein